MPKKESSENKQIRLRSSAAEYLTYVAATGDSPESYEMRYEDENIWLTQKMMAALYGISVSAINQHLKTVFADGELKEKSVIKKYLITADDHNNILSFQRFSKGNYRKRLLWVCGGLGMAKQRKILYYNGERYAGLTVIKGHGKYYIGMERDV